MSDLCLSKSDSSITGKAAWKGGRWLKLRQAVKELNQAMREQRHSNQSGTNL